MNRVLQLVASLLALSLVSCASQVSSIKKDIDVELKAKQGYLMLAVDTNYSLREIRLRGEENIIFTTEDLKSGSNYILVPVPAGQYRVDSIRVSDFIFKNFEKDLWSFKVNEGVISYVGHLDMQTKYRYLQASSAIQLLNKSSYALEYLEKNFQNILSGRQLQYWGPGEDDFFVTVLQETGAAK